jgi:simple sugar transport system permease protein
MISRAGLLMMTGAGVVIAFRAGVFNLGGEGQVYLGAIIATVTALSIDAATIVPVSAAALSGGVLCGVSGLLRRRTGADELITSFLLSATVTPVINYLIVGPLRDERSSLLATPVVPPRNQLTELLPPSSLTIGVVWSLVVVGLLWAVLRGTLFGYELRIVGYNRRLARYAGIPLGLYTTAPMALSGMLHGLAGAVLALGVHNRSISEFSGGLGWNGIAVALIARNRPLLLVPAAIFFAFLESGARATVLQNRTTWELGAVIQAVVFLFVTADVLARAPRRRTRGAGS